ASATCTPNTPMSCRPPRCWPISTVCRRACSNCRAVIAPRRRWPAQPPNKPAAASGRAPMERKKASDFPQELLNLFDRYVHGGISRRGFLDGAQKFAVGGLTTAALFRMLKPNYAWAIQVPPDDKRIKAGHESVPSPQGNGSIKG